MKLVAWVLLGVLLAAGAIGGCSEDNPSEEGSASEADLRDSPGARDVSQTNGADAPDSGGNADDASLPDQGTQTGEDATTSETGALDAPADSTMTDLVTTDPNPADVLGPDNPDIACLTDDTCGGGECCTEANQYVSFCADSCINEGRHDACITAAQCQARRPGEWEVCCHDWHGYDYCAPLPETCTPLTPCDEPTDCASEPEGRVCCSRHAFYGERFCVNEFLAVSISDCP